jgi:multiple sugar transport system permease protein
MERISMDIDGRKEKQSQMVLSVTPWVLLLPFMLIYSIFFIYPAVETFYLSLTESSLTATERFIGLENYVNLLQDFEFWDAIIQTFYFALLTVIPLTVLGLVLALLVNRIKRGSQWVQAIFFIPNVLPISVMVLLVGWMFNAKFGVMHHLFSTDINVFSDVNWAMPTVAGATIWWTVGFNMLLFLAALNNIPKDLYEAAALDGATPFGTFRYITFRYIRPTVGIVFILQLIASLKIFGQTFLMTKGGPFDATKVVLHYMYETGFIYQDAGYASAIAIVFLLIVVAILLLQALVGALARRVKS